MSKIIHTRVTRDVWGQTGYWSRLVFLEYEAYLVNFIIQVESAPKVASPVYNSPKTNAVVNQNNKPQEVEPQQQQTEVDGAEVTQKKTFVFEMKTKGSVVVSTRKFFPC